MAQFNKYLTIYMLSNFENLVFLKLPKCDKMGSRKSRIWNNSDPMKLWDSVFA